MHTARGRAGDRALEVQQQPHGPGCNRDGREGAVFGARLARKGVVGREASDEVAPGAAVRLSTLAEFVIL